MADLCIQFVAKAQHVEPFHNLFATLEACYLVLDLHILQCCEFREETKFLKEVADVALSQLYPVSHFEVHRVVFIKHHTSAVVAAIANNIAAKGAFAFSGVCFNEVKMSFFEDSFRVPDF